MKGSGIQMKKNLEEMQVKVANKRAILESHDGEEFSPITVAKNVLCEDGTTMQDYFDNHSEPNISTKIVNSNSMSKVGQGDSVDFSDNVMDGAYEDVVLKGKSLVNVIQGSSKDKVVLPYSFEEGEGVTINDTHTNGRVEVEVKGRTLVNLVLEYNISDRYLRTPLNHPVVFGRQYLVRIFNCPINFKGVTIHNKKATYQYTYIPINKPWTSNNSNATYDGLELDLLSDDNIQLTDEEKENIRILFVEYQEGMENWDIPYFESMASVQSPTVQTVGKNLFDKATSCGGWVSNETGETLEKDTLGKIDNIVSDYIKVIPSEQYVSNTSLYQWYYDGNKKFIKNSNTTGAKIIPPSNAKYVVLGKSISRSETNFQSVLDSLQLEKGTSSTAYERYQSSSLTLPEEVVLRGFPNGVCDTYNTKTKEYVRRIGEVVLDGGEAWVISFSNQEGRTPFAEMILHGANSNKMPICDKLIVNNIYSANTNLGCSIELDSSTNLKHLLRIRTQEIVNGQTLEEFKQWLSLNPITVQYELATPIITEIDLPSLKTYNTITHLSSTVGEGSLVPTLASDHTVDYPVVIKPNTKYSIIANHRCRGDEENPISFNLGGANSTVVPGERVTTITTPSTLTHSELRVSGRETQISDVMVIEGEVNRQVPYFEGIGDCKSPILKSVGKNLFDINGEFTKCSYSMGIPFKPSYDATSKLDVISPNEFVITTPNNSYNDGFGQYIDVSGVDEVTVGVTALFNHSKTNLECKVMFLRVGEAIPTTIKDRDELLYPVTTINVSNGDRAELTLRTRQYARVFVMLSGAWKSEMSGTCSFTIKDVYVGANEEYEPYKSNTTTFTSNDDEIIVLRSLPNGVCDTLNVKTGEYIQIIGEITLDGTKRDDLVYYAVLKDNDGDFIRMIINGCSFYDNNKYGNCDKLPFYHEEKIKDSVEAVFPFAGEKHFYIKIKTSRINGAETMENNSSQLRDAFLNWLAQNPITVQYELETPIVKQVNVEGYPYAYENGHILLESGSQEQSLTPSIEYSIVANRGGQIRSNQRTVERHQKKLDSLYAMTLVNMIDSQYKQVLMKLKSDLGSEVTSWDI